ncbi:MAG: DUF4160 domain-containing protein [Verrucomicrobiota bacterium]
MREKGYRIGFYSSEPDGPAHVHVHKSGGEAKFWLAPVQLIPFPVCFCTVAAVWDRRQSPWQ